MKYYIIAGEPSGDLHGSKLLESLANLDLTGSFRVWGGDLMAVQKRTTLVKHIRETAFMGVSEVIRNLPQIKKNIGFCKADLLEHRPDVLILIDYPGFNLRMAKFAKSIGIKVYYYISPKFWAWKEYRVERVKKFVDRMFLIFPFEIAFYQKHAYKADYVGNPLFDSIASRRKEFRPTDEFRKVYGLDERPIVAILPGSRKQEIDSILPFQLQTVRHFPNVQFVVAATNMFDISLYHKYIGDLPVKIVVNETYELLHNAAAGLITSGTASLETGLFQVPQVVCMRTSWLTYHLVKMVIKVKYLSLVNLILDRASAVELIQADLNENRLVAELSAILPGGDKLDRVRADYQEMEKIMGGIGASTRAATAMIAYLRTDVVSKNESE
ncbi:MAG: hypothetical protein RIS47_989 [Bacteroidota bacterium]|jgi:lipid-A-disaccharide synthase